MAEINGWMSLPDTVANTVFAAGGWDSVTLDAQHGFFDERAMRTSLQTLAGARPRRLVRLPANDAAFICKALDAGADGVIAPMISSAADARRLATACFYPPRGARSFGPTLALMRAGDLPYEAAALKVEVWAMIETREALEEVAGIAAVEGISGLYVGPNDLALALGLPSGSDREEPEMEGAFNRILEAAQRHAKRTGIYCASPAYARRMAERGFDLVTAASDTGLLARAAGDAVATARG